MVSFIVIFLYILPISYKLNAISNKSFLYVYENFQCNHDFRLKFTKQYIPINWTRSELVFSIIFKSQWQIRGANIYIWFNFNLKCLYRPQPAIYYCCKMRVVGLKKFWKKNFFKYKFMLAKMLKSYNFVLDY